MIEQITMVEKTVIVFTGASWYSLSSRAFSLPSTLRATCSNRLSYASDAYTERQRPLASLSPPCDLHLEYLYPRFELWAECWEESTMKRHNV